MSKIYEEYEWRDKEQRFGDDEEGRNVYLDLFQNESKIRAVEEFLGFTERGVDGAGEVEGSVIRLAMVHAWVAAVVKCLAEQETWGGQGQKMYAGTQ